mmetsp:Transcript_8325/g.18642  ORF Transcript_8325/g.18642 Transcript_8325/m.18642 type:complete len:217 (+) Transcript_8325:1861-2511(+)
MVADCSARPLPKLSEASMLFAPGSPSGTGTTVALPFLLLLLLRPAWELLLTPPAAASLAEAVVSSSKPSAPGGSGAAALSSKRAFWPLLAAASDGLGPRKPRSIEEIDECPAEGAAGAVDEDAAGVGGPAPAGVEVSFARAAALLLLVLVDAGPSIPSTAPRSCRAHWAPSHRFERAPLPVCSAANDVACIPSHVSSKLPVRSPLAAKSCSCFVSS